MIGDYALNIDEKKRVLSATYDAYAPTEWPRVESLPEGDITDYKYINGQFVHEPLPKPDPPIPPEPDDTAAEIECLKERINNLEQNAIYN